MGRLGKSIAKLIVGIGQQQAANAAAVGSMRNELGQLRQEVEVVKGQPVGGGNIPPKPPVQQQALPPPPPPALTLEQRFAALQLDEPIGDKQLAEFAYQQVRERLGGQYNSLTENRVGELRLGDTRSPKPVTISNLEIEVVRDTLQETLRGPQHLNVRTFPKELKSPTLAAAADIVRAARAGGSWNQQAHLEKANEKVEELKQRHQSQAVGSTPPPAGNGDPVDLLIATTLADVALQTNSPGDIDHAFVEALRQESAIEKTTSDPTELAEKVRVRYDSMFMERATQIAKKLGAKAPATLDTAVKPLVGQYVLRSLVTAYKSDDQFTAEIDQAIATKTFVAPTTPSP